MANRIVQTREGSVMHKSRLHRHITERRGAKFVTVGRVAGDLLQTKVFIEARPIKSGVGQGGRNLRDPNDMLLKVTEHLIGLARHTVTDRTPGRAEEQ